MDFLNIIFSGHGEGVIKTPQRATGYRAADSGKQFSNYAQICLGNYKLARLKMYLLILANYSSMSQQSSLIHYHAIRESHVG